MLSLAQRTPWGKTLLLILGLGGTEIWISLGLEVFSVFVHDEILHISILSPLCLSD